VKQGAGEKNARLLFPIVATIFLYVITNAYLALLPIFGTIGVVDEHHGFVSILRAANTDINLPLSIAVIAFLFIEYLGIRAHGLFPYIREFFNFSKIRDGFSHLFKGKIGPALGSIFYGFIDLFIGAIEVLSHWIRIISFTFRLFGNMTAGEILLLLIMFLVPMLVVIPFFGLELLVGVLQALIFAGLTLVFGVMALSSHSEEH
jgi:F-type H+-transporting ATPase subunit a